MLWHFLHFRLEVVTKRLQHELAELARRMHILEGFATVFDALDEILKIIRASDGKADAAKKIMARFKLDAEQTDAILELRLYRLARLEILVIQEELEDEEEARRARSRSSSPKKAQGDLGHRSRRARRAQRGLRQARQAPHDHRGGRRGARRSPRRSSSSPRTTTSSSRATAGSSASARSRTPRRRACARATRSSRCVAGSTKASVVFFSNYGTAYTCRIVDVPATTGYGEPIQKLFKMKDGETIVAMASLDPRLTGKLAGDEEHYPETYALAASYRRQRAHVRPRGLRRAEHAQRSPLRAPLARARPIVGVEIVHGDETVIAVSKKRRALLCDVERGEVPRRGRQGRPADEARRGRRAPRDQGARRTIATRSS